MTAEANPVLPSPSGGAPWSFRVLDADPLVAEVRGEIDTLTGPRLRERLVEALDASSGPVRLDLAGVTFIDSQGLAMLIAAHRHVPDRPITLAGAVPTIRRLMEITGLDRIFALD